MRCLTFFFVLLISSIFNSTSANAQVVETLGTTLPGIPESIAIDNHGNLYIASPPAGLLLKMKPDGTYVTLFGGFNFPVGGGFDNQGNFYLSSLNAGIISKITPDSNITLQYASGFNGPVGVIPDPTNTFLYVANNFSNSISKLYLNDSTVTSFTSSPLINRPDGFAYDDQGNLYLANFNDSRVNKIDTNGIVTTLATFPGSGIGYITWSNGSIYVAGYNNNKIYKVTPAGDTGTVAGTGVPGYMDGPANTAQFDRPNGIAASLTGDTIFVADADNKRIRMIILNQVGIQNTGINIPDRFELNQNYPNPFNPETIIKFGIPETLKQVQGDRKVRLSVYDISGREIALLVNKELQPGTYEYSWNAGSNAGGVYFYKLQAGEYSETRKMMLVK